MYSLGNFVSSMGESSAKDTFIAEIRITKEFGGAAVISGEIYHPCRLFVRLGEGWFVVVPTDNTELADIADALEQARERILAILFS